MSPRKKKHSKQTKVILKLQSSRSIEVVFAAPESDGGDHITKYKIEWDLFPVFDSNEEYPLGSYSKIVPIGMNAHGSYSHVISGLSTGVLYYVRIYSYNSYGYSYDAGYPSPPFLSPKTQAQPPNSVHVTYSSVGSVSVAFPSTSDNGSDVITKYLV